MKKRLLCVLVAAVLLLGVLTGCGGSTGESPGPDGSANPATSESPAASDTPEPSDTSEPFSGPTGEVVASGEAGETVTWALYSDGTLVISGTGPMEDYDESDVSSLPWSEHRDGISKAVIENGVTSIGECAFYGCSSLTSVAIPNSVTSIGAGALAYCGSLTNVTIPDSVNSIGMAAFAYCGLTSVTIPNSVYNIGWDTFIGCGSLTSATISDGVTSIGERAFQNCGSLTSVTIPASVTYIGAFAFTGCTLTDVYYGGSEGQWNQKRGQRGWNSIPTDATIHCSSYAEETMSKDTIRDGFRMFLESFDGNYGYGEGYGFLVIDDFGQGEPTMFLNHALYKYIGYGEVALLHDFVDIDDFWIGMSTDAARTYLKFSSGTYYGEEFIIVDLKTFEVAAEVYANYDMDSYEFTRGLVNGVPVDEETALAACAEWDSICDIHLLGRGGIDYVDLNKAWNEYTSRG